MVKISCPKCEAKKVYLLSSGSGNVPGANMNLACTGLPLSHDRSMATDHQMVPLGTEQSEHLNKDWF